MDVVKISNELKEVMFLGNDVGKRVDESSSPSKEISHSYSLE